MTDVRLIGFRAGVDLKFSYQEGDCRYRVVLNYNRTEDRWNGHRVSVNDACQLSTEINAYDSH